MLTQPLINIINTRETWTKKDLQGPIKSLEDALVTKLENNGKLTKVYFPKFITPIKVSVGDVISVKGGLAVHHPAIIWKIREGIYYCITMSSHEGLHNMYKLEHSRLFNGVVSKTIFEITEEEALKAFVTVFDNKKELKIIFSKIKEYYGTLVK